MEHKTFYLGKHIKSHVNEYTNSEGDHYSDLISYTTRVASYNHLTNKIQIFGHHSTTTEKHINEFLQFYGFDTMTKKEIENYNN